MLSEYFSRWKKKWKMKKMKRMLKKTNNVGLLLKTIYIIWGAIKSDFSKNRPNERRDDL